MTDEDRKHADHLQQQALCLTDHPDKAASLLMTGAMAILQRRYGAEKSIEHMIRALDFAGGGEIRAAIHGSD